MDYLKLFQNHSEYEAFVSGGTMMKPNVSHCVQENEVHYNPIKTMADEYLTFIALENGTFGFTPLNNNVINYSLDEGKTWTVLAANTTSPMVTAGNKIMWKGEMTPLMEDETIGVGIFSSTGRFDVQGNIMSLLYGDDFKGQTDLTEKEGVFANLFTNLRNTCNVVNAKNLALPATTLASGCYYQMFNACPSLTAAPTLPAVTLANGCYSSMFEYCTSLTTAPELPATTLAEGCYAFMFNGCTSLNYIKCLATDISASNCTNSWVSGVASSGTFVRRRTEESASSNWERGANGIPTGWTVETVTV